MPKPEDPLDSMLENWRSAPPPLAESVTPEVWRRIAAGEAGLRPPLGWRERIEEIFSRPSFAITFVAACLLLGLFVAEVRVSRLESARSAQLAKSYLQLIDPLLAGDPAKTAPSASRP